MFKLLVVFVVSHAISTSVFATDACAKSPCLNYGTCIPEGNEYRCTCKKGYTGIDCGKVTDHCAGVLCLNGATCVNSLHTYTCKCDQGFYGPHCEYDDVPDVTAIGAFLGLTLASLVVANVIIFRIVTRIRSISKDHGDSKKFDVEAIGSSGFCNYGGACQNEFCKRGGENSRLNFSSTQCDADSAKLTPLPTYDVESLMLCQTTVYDEEPVRNEMSSFMLEKSSNPGESCKDCDSFGSEDAMYYFRIFQSETENFRNEGKSETEFSPFLGNNIQ